MHQLNIIQIPRLMFVQIIHIHSMSIPVSIPSFIINKEFNSRAFPSLPNWSVAFANSPQGSPIFNSL